MPPPTAESELAKIDARIKEVHDSTNMFRVSVFYIINYGCKRNVRKKRIGKRAVVEIADEIITETLDRLAILQSFYKKLCVIQARKY